ncbi:MAG: cyclase family protein [Gemmatimonadetes bacterium]|nr:cyclase family protein [Gemmatimonadota bacterium]
MSDRAPTVYDISPPLGPETAVFPGDTPLERDVVLDFAQGDTVTLSTLRSTCHLGAHVDAPSHYDPLGMAIGERPLGPFMGTCRVVPVKVPLGGLVSIAMMRDGLAAGPDAPVEGRPDAKRVLIATGTYPDPAEFRKDFAALSPDLVDWLAAAGVILVGIDTPSVDPAESRDLPAHQAVRRHDLNILEGVVLAGVPPGRYELIALPLRLTGFDGSPVRAVLRPLSGPLPGAP